MPDLGSRWLQPPRILLSGRPGCGKTTLIQRLVPLIGPGRCAGFYTEEVRERGQRIGFDVVTLDGRRGPLARIGAAGPRVGRYGVDVGSFERLALSSLAAIERHSPSHRVVVLDEIGKMELFSAEFVSQLGRLLDDPMRPILGTVLLGRHPIVEPIRRRRDVEVVRVTPENRNRLAAEIGRVFVDFLADSEGAS
jgi:nucleoside-triphosphatase